MKKYLVTGFCVLFCAIWAQAQGKLTPEQEHRLDSLEQQVRQRIEQTQGEGAAVGMDGPWAMEQQILSDSFACVQKHTLAQIPSILVCLEPLRSYYETERKNRTVKRLTHTLIKQPFITSNGHPFYVAPFIEQHVPQILQDPTQQQALAKTLQNEQAPQVQLFLNRMLVWRTHLLNK